MNIITTNQEIILINEENESCEKQIKFKVNELYPKGLYVLNNKAEKIHLYNLLTLLVHCQLNKLCMKDRLTRIAKAVECNDLIPYALDSVFAPNNYFGLGSY